jgi:NTE family protein
VVATVTSQLAPLTDEGRSGIALCLSGGGFRAALFHLGALRRLHELGILQRLTIISTVSGGSIVAGQLLQSLHANGRNGRLDFADFQKDVADPFRGFASRDLRTWPVVKNLLWSWFLPGPLLRDLERRYLKAITTLRLADLPQSPRFVFCATDLTFGVNWEFSRDRVGSYEAGYLRSIQQAQHIPVAHAITASACFPPFFGPMPAGRRAREFESGKYRGKNRDRLLSKLVLSDGGVYDNMALEPAWKAAATVLVSDCGAPFDYVPSKPPFRTLLRYTSALSKQTQSLRVRMLQAAWSAPPDRRPFTGTRFRQERAIDRRCPPGRHRIFRGFGNKPHSADSDRPRCLF